MKILEDIKVVELAMYLPLPYAGAFIAKMGADVKKIEQPEKGDPLKGLDPSAYKALNGDKNIVYLDLKDKKDIKELKKIMFSSDIVLNGFRRGFLENLGLGFDDISKKNRKIIYINLYGYPEEISLKDKAGHDLNFLGLSGIFDHLKNFNKPLPVQIADMAGALWAIIGILLMLSRREKENRGGELDLSLFTSLISFMPFFYFSKKDGKIDRGLLYGLNPFYNVYECKDGKLMAVGSLEEKFARKLLEILKIKYNDNIFSDRNRDALYKKLKRVFRSKDQDFFIKLFEKEDICVTPVLSKEDFIKFLEKNLKKGTVIEDFLSFPIK
ncbi:MAG: CoA transferase [Proteobacteria bacterium]|nr:CoA transferase [Pseudomonadota bacterium]